MLRQITIKNLLSFGPDSLPLDLRPLNILIGANGSGKSNLIECLSVMASSTKNFFKPINSSGGMREWKWKGADSIEGSIGIHVSFFPAFNSTDLYPYIQHHINIASALEQAKISAESIALIRGAKSGKDLYKFDAFEGGARLASHRGRVENIPFEKISPRESVLSQFRDEIRYPEFGRLTTYYESIQFYREWNFGRRSSLRNPQPTDHPSSFLKEGGDNFAIVLNNLRSKARNRIMKALEALYPGIEDFTVQLVNNTAEFCIIENGYEIPATRLSDGTIRYLCLIAILCNPAPPPLIIIEEPELGLHPDVIGEVADMLKEASERTQIIVTTHSNALVDAFSSEPENVVVCEKGEKGTVMQRLKKDDLDEWLKKYSLGNLWSRGQIGGTRW